MQTRRESPRAVKDWQSQSRLIAKLNCSSDASLLGVVELIVLSQDSRHNAAVTTWLTTCDDMHLGSIFDIYIRENNKAFPPFPTTLLSKSNPTPARKPLLLIELHANIGSYSTSSELHAIYIQFWHTSEKRVVIQAQQHDHVSNWSLHCKSKHLLNRQTLICIPLFGTIHPSICINAA